MSIYLDTLLCHDDELEDRRVAFIYYLVPENWTEEDGGSLDMFSVNGKYMKILSNDSYNNALFFCPLSLKLCCLEMGK